MYRNTAKYLFHPFYQVCIRQKLCGLGAVKHPTMLFTPTSNSNSNVGKCKLQVRSIDKQLENPGKAFPGRTENLWWIAALVWFIVIHKVLHLKGSCTDYFGADFLTSVFQLLISFYFIFPKPQSFFFQVILTQLVALVKKYSNIQTKQESIAVEKDEKSRILQDTCNQLMQQQLGFGAWINLDILKALMHT